MWETSSNVSKTCLDASCKHKDVENKVAEQSTVFSCSMSVTITVQRDKGRESIFPQLR